MNRNDFQKLAALRIKEAKILLDANAYDGSYYLAGYAVECALKACIAKQTKRYDFPPKKEVVVGSYTHNLETLLNTSGLKSTLDKAFAADGTLQIYWSVVKRWNEGFRYEMNISGPEAHELYTAITDRKHGVLTWLKKHW